jgi:hypothetical protein
MSDTGTLYVAIAKMARDLLTPGFSATGDELFLDGAKVLLADGTLIFDGEEDVHATIGRLASQRRAQRARGE